MNINTLLADIAAFVTICTGIITLTKYIRRRRRERMSSEMSHSYESIAHKPESYRGSYRSEEQTRDGSRRRRGVFAKIFRFIGFVVIALGMISVFVSFNVNCGDCDDGLNQSKLAISVILFAVGILLVLVT